MISPATRASEVAGEIFEHGKMGIYGAMANDYPDGSYFRIKDKIYNHLITGLSDDPSF